MATFDLTLTYPDGQGARIMNALKAASGSSSNAEAIDWLRSQVIERVKQEVIAHEYGAAMAAIAEPDVT